MFIPMDYFRPCARGWQDFKANDRMATVYAMALQFLGESLKFSKSLGTNPGFKETFYYTPDEMMRDVAADDDDDGAQQLPEDDWVTNYPKVICMVTVIVKNTKNVSNDIREIFGSDMNEEDLLDPENIVGILISQSVIDPELSLHRMHVNMISENISKSPEYERQYVCSTIPRPQDREEGDRTDGAVDQFDDHATRDRDSREQRQGRYRRYGKQDEQEASRGEDCLFRRITSRKKMLELLIDGISGDGETNVLDERALNVDSEVDRIISDDNDNPANYRSQCTLVKALERARSLCPGGNSPQLSEQSWYIERDGHRYFRPPVPTLSWFMKPEQMSAQRMWGRLFPWSEPSLELLLCRVIGRIMRIAPDTLRKEIHANIESEAQSRVADSLEAPQLAQMRGSGSKDIVITSRIREISNTVHMFRDFIITRCLDAEKRGKLVLASKLKPALTALNEVAMREMHSTMEPSANIPEPVKALGHWQETARDRSMCFTRTRWCRNLGTFGNMITAMLQDFSTSGIATNGFALLRLMIARDSVYIDMQISGQLPMHTILASVPAGGKSKIMRMVAHFLSVPGTMTTVSGSSAMGLLQVYSEKVPGDQVMLLDEMPRMFTAASRNLSSMEQKVKGILQSVLTSGTVEYTTTEKKPSGQPVQRTRSTECNMVVIGGTNDKQTDDAMNTRFSRCQMSGTTKPGRGALFKMFARKSAIDTISADNIATRHRKAHFVTAMGFKGIQIGWMPAPCDDLLQMYMTTTLEWLEKEHGQLLSQIRNFEIASSMAGVLTVWFARHIVFSSEISPFRLTDTGSLNQFRDFHYKDLMRLAPYLFVNEDIIFYVLSGIVHSAVDPSVYKLIKWIAEAKARYRFHLLWDDGLIDATSTREEEEDPAVEVGKKRKQSPSSTSSRAEKRKRVEVDDDEEMLDDGEEDDSDLDDDDDELLYDRDDPDDEELEARFKKITSELFRGKQQISLGYPKIGNQSRNQARDLRRAGITTAISGRPRDHHCHDDTQSIDYPLANTHEMHDEWIKDCKQRLGSYSNHLPYRYKQEFLDIGTRRVMHWNYNYVQLDGSLADCASMFTVQNPSSKMSQDDVMAMLNQLRRRTVRTPYLPLVNSATSDIRHVDIERFRDRLCKHPKCARQTAPMFIAGDAECFLLISALRHSPDQITAEMLWNLCTEDTVERDVVLAIQNADYPNLLKVFHAKPRPGRRLVCRNANYVSKVHKPAVGDIGLDDYRDEAIFVTDKNTVPSMLARFFKVNGLEHPEQYTLAAIEKRVRQACTKLGIARGLQYPDDAERADDEAEKIFSAAVRKHMSDNP